MKRYIRKIGATLLLGIFLLPGLTPSVQPTPTPIVRLTSTPRPYPTGAPRPTPPPHLTPPPSPTISPRPTPAPRPTAPPHLTPPPSPTISPRPTPAPRPHPTLPPVTPTATPTATVTSTPTPTATPACSPGLWTQAVPVTTDHYGGFIDSDGIYAYEGGGYSFTTGDNVFQFGRFDPVANTWTLRAPVPDQNNATASGVYAPNVNKLFVFGGIRLNTAIVVNTTRIYDIASNTWSTAAPMPDVRSLMGSGYYNGKIYLVGGFSTGNIDPSFGQVWEYDPVLNAWDTSRMSMPITLGGAGSGVINGHLYIVGGRNSSNDDLTTVYDYDITADTWTQRANVPTGINAPGSAVICGKLWIFGGGNPFFGPGTLYKSGEKRALVPDTTNILQIYDPATNTWTTGPGLNQARSFVAGTHVGNTAVAIGGYTGTTTTNSVEINVATGEP